MSEDALHSRENRPTIAVVIGAIGVRAAAAIPLFELLDEAAIHPELLIGSGGGAFMAALRGGGFSTRRMRELVNEVLDDKFYTQTDYGTLLGLVHPKLGTPGLGSALKKPHRQQAFFQQVFGALRLEALRPRTLLQTADCATGDAVLLGEGLLAETVYAAGAVSPEFPPLRLQGRWLVDGAYVSPIPVLEAVKRQADVILALYHEERPNPRPANLLEANFNLLATYFRRLAQDQITLAIGLHHHEIVFVPIRFDDYIGPWQVSALPAILQAGEQAVAKQKEEILRIVRGA